MENKIRIGFTLGDVNGIGPEVMIKALQDKRILNMCTPIIYASNRIISYYKKMLQAEHFNYSNCNNPEDANTKTVNIINCIQDDVTIQPGMETEAGGKYATVSLDAATADLMAGHLDAMVTAPFHKNNMQQAGFGFPGHTEYLQDKAGGKNNLMFLLGDSMRVGLVTNHVPVKDIAAHISKNGILEKIELMHKSLMMDFALFKPTIAVLGLNPHAGDSGALGDEEKNIIIPAIREAQESKIFVSGPFPADGFFGSGNWQKFDAILAMYHDQGLVPFKAMHFGAGVNFTAGLPFVRTSPDHGTAFDIAGKGLAHPDSMLQAIFTAIDIVRNRRIYLEVTANPVKKSVVESEKG
ncbi:MAG: 4-hydroxythreonine-4-phosphate dehydrogenase PdxA [Chitinophagales bacterium]